MAAVPVVPMPLDGKYYLANQRDFLNIVAWDWTDAYQYVRDRWDCDKFALRFKSQVDRHFGRRDLLCGELPARVPQPCEKIGSAEIEFVAAEFRKDQAGHVQKGLPKDAGRFL